MKQKFISYFFLSLCMSFVLLACNSNEKKAEETAATDTTAKEPAAAVTPAPAPAVTEETIDAVKAAPKLYKIVSDTLGIRVLEATYKPGDSSALHTHPVNAIYVISGGKADFIGKDGSKTPTELKTGTSMVRGYNIHSIKNTGKTTMKVLLVEVNRPNTIVPADAATDATKVASANYKTLSDSLGIRIVEVNYKPGQTSAFHSHPDLAAYAIIGGKGELTSKDGKKNVLDLKTGMAWISAADGHSAKNTGKNAFKLILFEVSRARN
jgi:quercetin dioxygenase-like cupin family protein